MNARGFSFIELVVSIALLLMVAGSMFDFVHSARGVFEIDLERADMHQRVRVGMDALFRDLVMAGAGLQIPAVVPFRRGLVDPDPPESGFPDRISVVYVPPDVTAGSATITYARHVGPAGVPHLTRYDGIATELPLVDHVADLRFEYFDLEGNQMATARLADGPWIPNAVAVDRFDADLLAIRRVRAIVRVRPARAFVGLPVADLEVRIDVSPRNLNLQ